MSDIRDVSTYARPVYRNDYFGAQDYMSYAGAPAGMERTLRTTDLSIADVRQVNNSQLSLPQAASAGHRQNYYYYDLSQIIGEGAITGQCNLNEMNKKLATLVVTHLSLSNPQITQEFVELMLKEFIQGTYLNITAQETFIALAFFLSDARNWIDNHQGIIFPDWAVHFFHENKQCIIDCASDIHDQLQGNRHSQKFVKKYRFHGDKVYNDGVLKASSKPQRKLMLKAGEAYLTQQDQSKGYKGLTDQLLAYHDAVVDGLMNEICPHVIAAAQEKFSVTLSHDNTLEIISKDYHFKQFHEHAKELKKNLLFFDDLSYNVPKASSKAKQLFHFSHTQKSQQNNSEFHPDFVRAAGLLLINLYSFPIPDAFRENILKEGSDAI